MGLRYEALQPTAAMMGIAMTPALFGDIQDMEAAALDAWAERRKRERPRS